MCARKNSDAKGLAGRSATVEWFDNAACVTDLESEQTAQQRVLMIWGRRAGRLRSYLLYSVFRGDEEGQLVNR